MNIANYPIKQNDVQKNIPSNNFNGIEENQRIRRIAIRTIALNTPNTTAMELSFIERGFCKNDG